GKSATLKVSKTWVVTDASGTTIGTTHIPAQSGDDPLPDGLSAQLTLTGPGAAGATNQAWGTARTGYSAGNTATIDESASVDVSKLPGCTLVTKQVTQSGGVDITAANLPYTPTLVKGENAFGITNTVKCTTTLSLVKDVAFGSAATDLWTLSATKPSDSGALNGPTGKYSAGHPVSGTVTAATAYTLAEAGGPATYVPTAAGWVCKDAGGAAVTNTSSAVKVPLGQTVTCTITNTTAKLTILKHIDGDDSLNANFWNLTASPASGVSGLNPNTVTGAEGNGGDPNTASTFEVRPGHSYTISEALNAAHASVPYLQVGIQKWDGSNWVAVTSDQVSVDAGQQAVYRFVNSPVPTLVLPLTGGVGTDAYLIAGLLALLVAVSLAIWQWRRTVRMGRP
ncbi:MAG: LPXTG cell wall anchor domain-containing protein, partial [Microbacteriaceae bacterium]